MTIGRSKKRLALIAYFGIANCVLLVHLSAFSESNLPYCHDRLFEQDESNAFVDVSWKGKTKSIRRRNLWKYDFDLYGNTKEGYAHYLSTLNASISEFAKKQSLLFENRKSCRKKLTVLVAMDADETLMPYAFWDLYEMETTYHEKIDAVPGPDGFRYSKIAGSTLKKDLVLQFSGTDHGGIRRLHIFQTDQDYDRTLTVDHFKSQVQEFKRGNQLLSQSPSIQILPEVGFANKASRFEEFLQWGIHEFPADHYLVVLWGHGNGWQRDSISEALHLTGDELSAVLKRIRTNVLGRPLDVLAMDACFMQNAETLADLAPSTSFIAGSAQVQDHLGLPYRTLFYELEQASYANLTGRFIAERLPIAQRKTFQRGGFQARVHEKAIESFTYSSVDSRGLESTLLPQLSVLAKRLTTAFASHPNLARALRAFARDDETFNRSPDLKEIGYFLRRIQNFIDETPVPELEEVLHRVLDQLRIATPQGSSVFVHREVGSQYRVADESQNYFFGMNIWLPRSKKQFDAFSDRFRFNALFQADSGAWEGMMKSLYSFELE